MVPDPAIRATRCLGRRKPLLLTKREREVFDLLTQGLMGEEIATGLTIARLLAKRKHLLQAIDQKIRDSGIKVSPVAILDDLDRIRHR